MRSDGVTRGCLTAGGSMQAFVVICSHVAEIGVFMAAAAALVFGALGLR